MMGENITGVILFLVSSTCFERCFQLIHDTSRQRLGWILPDAVNTVKCSWWWAKTSFETC